MEKLIEFFKFIIDLFFNATGGIFTVKSLSIKKIKSEFKRKNKNSRFSQKTYDEEEKEKKIKLNCKKTLDG